MNTTPYNGKDFTYLSELAGPLWSAMPRTALVLLLLMGAMLQERHLVVFACLVLLLEGLIIVSKRSIALLPLPESLVSRPRGESGYDGGCGAFHVPSGYRKPFVKSSGMPSGHALFAAALSTMMLLHMQNRKVADGGREGTKVEDALAVGAGGLFALAVAASRVYVGCHSVPQALIGLMLGFLFGGAAYLAAARYLPAGWVDHAEDSWAERNRGLVTAWIASGGGLAALMLVILVLDNSPNMMDYNLAGLFADLMS